MNMHAVQNLKATIGQLKPGQDYPGANINSRTFGRTEELEQLAASIKQEGLLMPLIVVGDPKDLRAFYVIDGNRRRAAIELLLKRKEIEKDAQWDIRVESNLDAADALRKSLAANMHVPLHPVDQFETFAACITKGDKVEDIAKRYALEERVVKQRLALGQMSPAVRKAWREGKIGREAAEAYAATNNHQVQEKHLKRGGWEAKNAHNIRQAMVGDASEIDKLLNFVGEPAYKAAGGKLVEDLFGAKAGKQFADIALLRKLAADEFKKRGDEYVAKGWGWAAYENDLPGGRNARYSMQRKDKPTAEEKKKLGVVMYFDWNDKFVAETGFAKKGVKVAKDAPTKGAAAKAKARPANVLSNSLKDDLKKMAARATKMALANEKAASPLAAALAGVVGSQITPDRYSYMPGEVRDKLAAIRDAISPRVMTEALQKHFDAKRYFPGAPKLLVIRAVTEAGFAADAKKLNAGTKAAAWKWALANVPKTGWLPPELRCATYSGPGAAKKAKR